jgi:hypothetical protein
MVNKHALIGTLLTEFWAAVADGYGPFRFRKKSCEDCTVLVASTNTGWPKCVVYNTDGWFKNQGFENSEAGYVSS